MFRKKIFILLDYYRYINWVTKLLNRRIRIFIETKVHASTLNVYFV